MSYVRHSVVLCFFTMICWGSWANTQKLSPKSWSFTLFYWDYSIGVLLFSLFIGLTFGSFGEDGRPLIDDLFQADKASFVSAFFGGVIFNLANLLIVAAISIAGMSVAFPVGIGIALILGVLVNYIATPVGNPILLFFGVFLIGLAIILDALAYKFQAGKNKKSSTMGIIISVIGGILMGLFYRFVASSMSSNFTNPEDGLFTPYSAILIFSTGIFISNFLFILLKLAVRSLSKSGAKPLDADIFPRVISYKPLLCSEILFAVLIKNSNSDEILSDVFIGFLFI